MTDDKDAAHAVQPNEHVIGGIATGPYWVEVVFDPGPPALSPTVALRLIPRIHEDDDPEVPPAWTLLGPGLAFELAGMLGHAATHAADAAGLCIDCGEPLDEHERDDDDEHQDQGDVVSRWGDVEFLANASEHLDSVLATLREKHAAGDTWTTAQIAEELILSNDQYLAYDGPEGGGPMLLDAVSRLAATAIQRLVSGD
jgi:hypothetical protein